MPGVVAGGADDVILPSFEVVQGCLKNSEILSRLDTHFSDLEGAQRKDIVREISSNLELFSNEPTRTNVIEHDIDGGDSTPIKQHAYRVNPAKRARLQSQVDNMLENLIAEPSSSAWSSPRVLSIKSDGSDRFCTDYCKVNNVTKPDCMLVTNQRQERRWDFADCCCRRTWWKLTSCAQSAPGHSIRHTLPVPGANRKSLHN